MSEENKLPGGWVWTKLGTVAAINPGLNISAMSDTTPVSFVPMAAVEAGTGRMDGSIQRPLREVKRGFTAFQDGDVLFAKITPCMENGKSVVAQSLQSGIGFGSTEFHVLRPASGISAQLLYYYVAQESFRHTARANMTGTAGQLRVPAPYLVDASYPLAPLAEQQRIVAAIEQQFTRLDAGVAALKSAQTKLKRYRAAVLKAAVEGKLTEAWRAEHPNAEPASVLLQRILAERRARWEADLRAKGKDPAKVRYEEPAGPDTTELPELPEGWCWSPLGQCFAVYVGATPSRKEPNYWDGDIPWVSSGEVQFCRIKETREHITQAGLDNSSTQINPAGSVLLGMIGEGRTRGQVAILDIAACNNQNCAAIWVSQTPVPSEFIYHWLWSQYEVTRTRGSGNNQPALNKSRVEDIAFPLPPLAEQEQIVAEVESRLSVVSELEATVEANLKRAERLRQSILREAFAGRLVPQDSNDEPAGVLLERIRQERVGNGRATKQEKERAAVLIEAGQVEQVEARPVSLWDE